MKLIDKLQTTMHKTVGNEDGVVGYGIAWLLGVPLSVLVVIYLIFGR
ncbi:MAG: hypothetical protein Q8T11_04785 [Elusimicrobiota bacterium]|nr:hypothetical protein [Elusimicrobiota bacterium]